MRIRMAFFSCTVVAMAALLAPTAAWATGSSCSAFNPQIEIQEGPCPVIFNDPLGPSCARPGDATGIKYRNVGSAADHLATLVTVNNSVSTATGNQVYGACSGDPLTYLGKYSCHEKAVKINPDGQTSAFWVVAKGTAANSGQRQPILTSVAAKKGSCIKSTAIQGLGLDGAAGNAFATTTKTETKVFKGCAVTFELNAAGDVLNAFNDPTQSNPTPGHPCSQLIISDAQDLTLTLDGVGDLGLGRFGDGYFSSGDNSCTTRIVGGRLYTWGSPCPN